jgi:hypothetical protein
MKTLITMKRTGLTAMLGLMLTGVWGQATQDRTPGDFTGIKAGGVFTINVTQGATNAVKVEAEESVLNNIKTEVKDGMLEISTEGKVKTEKPMIVNITVKELKKLDISGAAKLTGQPEFTGERIEISSSGASSIELPVKMNEVKIDASGAGAIKLSGTTAKLDADVSGAASLKAYELEANSANVRGSGAANIKVHAKEAIVADASGASTVKYKGAPASKIVNKSGSGSVKSADTNNEDTSSSAPGDTTKLKLGDNHVMVIKDQDDDKDKDDKKHKKGKGSFKHWQGIDLGVNGYVNSNNKTELLPGDRFMELDYARSINWSLNFFEKDIHIYRNYVNLVTGLGIEFGNYAFKNNITLLGDSTPVVASWDSVEYDKNKLKTTFINLPLMLEFNTSSTAKRAFHVAGGVILGYKLGSKTVQEFEIDGREYEVKEKDDFNLSPFRYSAAVRAGYGGFTVFANYALSTMFEKDKGPKLYPFTVGVSLNLN